MKEGKHIILKHRCKHCKMDEHIDITKTIEKYTTQTTFDMIPVHHDNEITIKDMKRENWKE